MGTKDSREMCWSVGRVEWVLAFRDTWQWAEGKAGGIPASLFSLSMLWAPGCSGGLPVPVWSAQIIYRLNSEFRKC